VHHIISPTSITLSFTSGMFFFVFKFYSLDQIINSAEADAAVDSTYVVVSIILIFLFGLGLCALEGSFINYDLAIGRFDFRPLGV
jgi:hypothetical protein